MIYEVRPKACREFPHTDRKKFQQISDLTLKNIPICPAAFNIVEEMKKNYHYNQWKIDIFLIY
jgi:Fe-S-cluster containining protein